MKNNYDYKGKTIFVGIDVHKKMLAVVVSDAEVDGEYQFERRMFGSNPEQLRSLAAWLLEQKILNILEPGCRLLVEVTPPQPLYGPHRITPESRAIRKLYLRPIPTSEWPTIGQLGLAAARISQTDVLNSLRKV